MFAACVITMADTCARSWWIALFVLSVLLPGFARQSLAMVEEEQHVGVDVLAILNTDETGSFFNYPSSVTYDRDMDEIYVVVGGTGKVIVFGSNFFPTASLSRGRGADAPRGVYIDQSSSRIYLCQAGSQTRPSRITTYNPAFFPQDEIVFSDMPEADNFTPQKMIIGLTGDIYVIGLNTKGVLVLNAKGEFSHWLKPMDKIITENEEDMVRADGLKHAEELALPTVNTSAENPDEEENTLDMRDLLPPGLLPDITEEETAVVSDELQPVQIADIATDSEGHLYILSEQTSKIYVYSASEELLYSFGQKGGSTGKMSRPKGLVVDEAKKALYVVDYMRHTILIFDLGGKYMYEFGGMGVGPGWFQYPVGLALNKEGNLIVADLFNHRVQILDVKFEYKFPLFNNPQGGQIKVQPQPEEEKTAPEPEKEEESIYLPEPLYL